MYKNQGENLFLYEEQIIGKKLHYFERVSSFEIYFLSNYSLTGPLEINIEDGRY